MPLLNTNIPANTNHQNSLNINANTVINTGANIHTNTNLTIRINAPTNAYILSWLLLTYYYYI